MTLLSASKMEEMCDRGWDIVCKKFGESDAELKSRCQEYYKYVRLYEATTRIRGFHETFAMVKGEK